MGIISDSVTGIQVKSRIRRLRQERKDLLDDGGRVRNINRAVDEAIADVNSYSVRPAAHRSRRSLPNTERRIRHRTACSHRPGTASIGRLRIGIAASRKRIQNTAAAAVAAAAAAAVSVAVAAAVSAKEERISNGCTVRRFQL